MYLMYHRRDLTPSPIGNCNKASHFPFFWSYKTHVWLSGTSGQVIFHALLAQMAEGFSQLSLVSTKSLKEKTKTWPGQAKV